MAQEIPRPRLYILEHILTSPDILFSKIRPSRTHIGPFRDNHVRTYIEDTQSSLPGILNMACNINDVCFDKEPASASTFNSLDGKSHSSARCDGCRGCLPRLIHRHSGWYCCLFHPCRRDSYRLSAKYESTRHRPFRKSSPKPAERSKSPLARDSSSAAKRSQVESTAVYNGNRGELETSDRPIKRRKLCRGSEIELS